MKTIKLLIADNGDIFREGLAFLLQKMTNIEVVATCAGGSETLQKVNELAPEIAIIDKYITEPGFVDVCQAIRKSQPKTRLVISQPFRDADYLSALRAEADAYIDKDIPVDILGRILIEISLGEGFLSPSIAALVLKESASSRGIDNWEYYKREIALTQRESQILGLMAQRGISNKEIASILFITEGTVKVHLTRIFEKMSVRGRHKAVALAREKGIIRQADNLPA
jgi:DNA-binding NarL/FixJ family response regulator